VKRLIVVPTQKEIDFLQQSFTTLGFHADAAILGRLSVVRFDSLGVTMANGGLGKVQFAIQTQHLLDVCPDWGLVICAGAAGALVDDLSPGDIVIATETVEHDIHSKFGEPLLPRFSSAKALVAELRNESAASASFQVRSGPIASGDEDVVDPERRREIHRLTGAFAVAWEGAGGARACHFSGVPFIEVRGITDQADGRAASHFRINLTSAMRNVATLITTWITRESRHLGPGRHKGIV
jgi:adenosylhomocysteine nucleosidase